MNNSFDNVQSDSSNFDDREAYEAQLPKLTCTTCGHELVEWCDEYSEGDFCPNCEGQDREYDGQPSEYDEWQDYMGGDDWDHGQYDEY